MREEAEQLNSEIKSLEADVRYTRYIHSMCYIYTVSQKRETRRSPFWNFGGARLSFFNQPVFLALLTG